MAEDKALLVESEAAHGVPKDTGVNDRYGFTRLVDILKRLRAPGGCPWDRKQTYETMCPHIIEEAYELVDAIERRAEHGMKHVAEECGDLMLQVAFVGGIAEERGDFAIADIAKGICDKLIRRHPHVFGDVVANDAETVLTNWEKIKHAEREASGATDTSALAGVPRGLPATVKAYRIQQKAASLGFDWARGDETPVFSKISEEAGEVNEALAGGDREDATGEVGDLLFAVVNLSRRLGIDPDVALQRTNRKFERRFRYIEKKVADAGGDWSKFTLDELDTFWRDAKKNGF